MNKHSVLSALAYALVTVTTIGCEEEAAPASTPDVATAADSQDATAGTDSAVGSDSAADTETQTDATATDTIDTAGASDTAVAAIGCQSQADKDYLGSSVMDSYQAVKDGSHFVYNTSLECGMKSAGSDDTVALTAACMKAPPYNIPISDTCLTCFGIFSKCSFDGCFQLCLDPLDYEVCHTCQVDNGCWTAMKTCAVE